MSTTTQTIATALEHHQSGQLDQAEHLYREVLRVDPEHAEALHLLGLAAHQRQKHKTAADYILRAIANQQTSAHYHNNLGSVYRALGKTADAINSFHTAIDLDADYAEPHFNLGHLYLDQHQAENAVHCYRAALQIRPDYFEARLCLADTLRSTGQNREAVDAYRQASLLQPEDAQVWFGLGSALHSLGQWDEAVECFQRALELRPDFAKAAINLGNTLKEQNHLDHAAAAYRRAIEIDVNLPAAHYNLGNILRELNQLDEAVACHQEAIRLGPNSAEAHNNLGIALQDLGKVDNAIESYERALSLDVNYAEAHFNRSRARLLKGDFGKGWLEYEWRWKYDIQPRNFSTQEWDGSSLTGQSILVYAEQGIGDEIMFASCLPEIIGEAAECVIECDRRLVTLFTRSFPSANIIARDNAVGDSDNQKMPTAWPDVDVQIAMGSLPRFLRNTEASFPRTRNYLFPNPQLCDKWRSRLAKFGSCLKVGISWRGGKDPCVRRSKSTNLAQWKPLLTQPGIVFVNLQYDDTANEIENIQQQFSGTIHNWDDCDPLKDMENFAAEISSLDLIISVSNATVHMAGALGVPVWTLLPYSPDWRWQLNRDDSPWYPSMKLFRQQHADEWDAVFQQIVRELQ